MTITTIHSNSRRNLRRLPATITTFLALIFGISAHASTYEVSFRSAHNQYFVNESNGGSGQTVNANRTAIGVWETMGLAALDQNCVRHGSRVSIRSGGSFYWRGGSDGSLSADRQSRGRDEVFTLINHSDPGRCLRGNDLISLRSAHNRYVVAERDGSANANREQIGSWEKFRVMVHAAPEFPPANAQGTEARKAEFRQIIRNHYFAQAFDGRPISDALIDEKINSVLTTSTGDFRLAEVVRILYLSGDRYADRILPALKDIDYWMNKGEDLYVYWSENHMILWMSSAYLLRQRTGWPMKENLDKRLNHWLDLKLQYGFYEFFSSTYHPFTIGPLLNLVDFAEDPSIRAKAAAVAQRFMRELLLVFNDRGSFYPAAGRNYPSRYVSKRELPIFWILTGRGKKPTGTEYLGGYLATSSIDLEGVAASYRSNVNVTIRQGHEQKDKTTVHAGFAREERTIFQWSSGAYFHPDTANDTAYTVGFYDLEDRKEFKDLAQVAFLPDSWMGAISKIGAAFSRGSNLSKATIDIFKNKNVVLTSLDNYFPGYRGYQQWPWSATIEDIAVWSQTGDIPLNFDKQGSGRLSQNSHFPKVQQQGNVAMLTYFPLFEIRNGTGDKAVNLFWPRERFDEHDEIAGHSNGNWLVARKNNSYIAVLRAGTGVRADGHPRHWGDMGRQMWAVVVGNSDMHGSYGNFRNVISRAKISESYKWNWRKFRRVYKTSISVDGKSLSNSW